MLPDVLPQLNSAQLEALKSQPAEKKKKAPKEEGDDEGEEGEVDEESDSDDDIPELVGQNFESISKQDWWNFNYFVINLLNNFLFNRLIKFKLKLI